MPINRPVVPVRAVRHGVLLALAALLAVALIPAGASAKSHKKTPAPKVSLTIAPVSQATAISRKKIAVKVKGNLAGTVSLKLAVLHGASSVALAKTKTVKVKKNKTTTVTVTLSAGGLAALPACTTASVKASATLKAGKKTSKAASKSAVLNLDSTTCVTPPPCDPIDGADCVLPFPSNYNTVKDPSTTTGIRVHFGADALPANRFKAANGQFTNKHIDPTEWNKNDGFSPGSTLLTRVPGVDTPQALVNSKLPAVDNIGTYAAADAGVVVIDTATGQRWPVWAEIDSNAVDNAHRLLIVRPAKNFLEGHRYVVGFRNLKNGSGGAIDASAAFKVFRDNLPSTDSHVNNRRAAMESIFKTLTTAGVARSSLNIAWDFTIASRKNLSERALQIRDDAFKQLGDTNLADQVVPAGSHSPAFTVTSVCKPDHADDVKCTDQDSKNRAGILGDPNHVGNPDFAANLASQVKGTVTVPCYLDNGCAPGGKFTYGPDGKIQQHGTYKARFVCNIPSTASAINPASSSMYGHGLFGDYDEAGGARDVWRLGHDHNIIVCGADWIGMADEDQGVAVQALFDLSKFPPLVDRLQQGYLDFNYIARALHTTAAQGGFASNVNFQDGGQPLIDTTHVAYYGNSQGGIAGGALTALAPDMTRSVLYVGAMNYSTLLPRSVDFDDFKPFLFGTTSAGGYSNTMEHPLLLALMQMLWDRGDPDGYAQHLTKDPLPNTPVHHVLMEIAIGDHQVSSIAALVEARTAGLKLRTNQTLAPQRLVGHPDFFWGVPTQASGALPTTDDGINIWDIGPLRPDPNHPGKQTGVPMLPMTNVAPADVGQDPHDYVIRNSPALRAQIATWIKAGGSWQEAVRGAIPLDAGDGCGVGNFCKIPDDLWDGTF